MPATPLVEIHLESHVTRISGNRPFPLAVESLPGQGGLLSAAVNIHSSDSTAVILVETL